MSARDGKTPTGVAKSKKAEPETVKPEIRCSGEGCLESVNKEGDYCYICGVRIAYKATILGGLGAGRYYR